MTQEIMDVVAKNLPAMQVDALRSELAKATRVNGLEADIKVKEASIRELQAKLGAAEEKNRRIDSLETKELQLEKRERAFEVELLKKDVEKHAAVSTMQTDLMKTVFRNPTVMRSTTGMDPVGNGMHSTISTSKYETTTQD